MATRSRIGILNKIGTVDSVYCHYDGYIDGNGVTLFENYATIDQVKDLMVKGDFSALGETLETTEYYVDRGEEPESLKARTDSSLEEFLQDREEYMYYFDEAANKWFVSKHGNTVISLQEAIDKNLDEEEEE